MKTCNKCNLEKPETDFYLQSAATGKRKAACKECESVRRKKYHTENREEILAKNKAYYTENKEEMNSKNKIYRVENREKIAARAKIHYAENREKIAAQNKINYEKNREERAAYSKIYRSENLEKIAAQGRLYRHGVTPDAFKRLFAEQGGVCAICGGLGGKKGLCVDHDHETGKVRGLLCVSCNRGIGFFKDSSEVAQLAINYLKQHGK